MIITISGPPGSGKTTAAKMLAKSLNYEFLSTGMIFRQMAEERGMTLAEFGKLATEDESIDRALDKKMVEMVGDNMVLEGRLAAHMLHLNGINAFKVWIDASLDTRVKRICGRESKDFETVKRENVEREALEHERYQKFYDIDSRSLAVYDLVIHSDDLAPEEVVTKIMVGAGLNE